MVGLIHRLGHDFADPALVEEAVSHRSWCAEHPGHTSNERLEFLGDAVLGWVTADVAFCEFTDMTEGDLTGIRKGVVNAASLAEIAGELGLGEYVRLGKGEAAAGGAHKVSILSDMMEAVIGAVYVDGGSGPAYEFVRRLVLGRVHDTAGRLDELDYKSTLQEMLAVTGRAAPKYDVAEAGPDHDKRFSAVVSTDGEHLGAGAGNSKRRAEQAAAAVAVKSLVAAGHLANGQAAVD